MENYLIAFVRVGDDPGLGLGLGFGFDSNVKKDEPAQEQEVLLARNLLDHSVQEVEFETCSSVFQEDSFSFLKYGENQIIKYGGDANSIATLITVESFERILLT